MNRCVHFAGLLGAAAFGAAPLPAAPAPALHWDDSPVSVGAAVPLTSYADVIDPARKAVVSIDFKRTVRVSVNPLLRQFFGDIPDAERQEEGLGSGVIVSADGYILTNNHVVEGADELEVKLADDSAYPAKLIGADPKTDIAVIKIDAKNLPTVTLANSDRLRVGDIVFAVGDPLDVGETVTMGIVSAKGRSVGLLDDVHGYENFIQTDAPINMGNSGGALIDAKGRLIGINCAILSPSHGNIGIGFAIPVNLAASIMQSLIATGTVARGDIGAEYQTISPEVAEQLGLPREAQAVVVTDISHGSPAEKAGLKPSDVILAVNNKAVATQEEMRLAIAELAPGSHASFKLVRDGKPLTIAVTLGRLVDRPDELVAGVDVTPLTEELRRKLGLGDDQVGDALVVTGVADDSPFADVLAPDMVIVEINRVPTGDLGAARQALHAGRNLLLVYYRGASSYLVIRVD